MHSRSGYTHAFINDSGGGDHSIPTTVAAMAITTIQYLIILISTTLTVILKILNIKGCTIHIFRG